MISSLLISALLVNPASVSIAPSAIETHVRYFASPELEGRMTLRPGIFKAAEYMASHFKKFGLEAREKGGSYFHHFDISSGFRMTKNNMLVINLGGGQSLSLEAGKDFVPLVGSATRLVNASMVWVANGEEADYTGLDVTDKIVVCSRGAQDGQRRTSVNKARLAKSKGAKAILFVGPSAEGRAELPALTRIQGIPDSVDIVAAAMHQKHFDKLAGMSFSDAMKNLKPGRLNGVARLVSEAEANTGQCRNVIGYLPGTDPVLKNEFIIIGGHFDHLGNGEIGSRTGMDMFHFGADDNASGTAGVIAAAEWFTRNRIATKRTIIFQGYSAEELGLRGSGAWATDNQAMLPNVSAMLNMDMIGGVRFDQTFVYGLSSSEGWLPVFKNVKVDGLRLLLMPNTRGDSDQASFVRYNVPALFFHTGLTDEYHTEKDTPDRVNYKGAADVVEAVIQTALAVDALPSKLAFNPKVDRSNKPTDRNKPTGPMESPLKP